MRPLLALMMAVLLWPASGEAQAHPGACDAPGWQRLEGPTIIFTARDDDVTTDTWGLIDIPIPWPAGTVAPANFFAFPSTGVSGTAIGVLTANTSAAVVGVSLAEDPRAIMVTVRLSDRLINRGGIGWRINVLKPVLCYYLAPTPPVVIPPVVVPPAAGQCPAQRVCICADEGECHPVPRS